ncbi:polysaccharide biosynthesis/export family protein [Fulvivirga ligni]|uniref:polysaccharide biosynthesis/export family protein n=1 Tax=Fulvivirga ligni TaxID=2904246 RepID=UPI001F2DE2D5|nr:polysaccharide biosynthesis/export family protein [Fulvivirga ligni]UII23308.1 polysaccharide biosynthesis/export family protein [Fulvivirga ligni]
MFKNESNRSLKISEEVRSAESNYLIEKNDYLSIEVYTHNGEQLIDPENHLKEISNTTQTTSEEKNQYLVNIDGFVDFPMVGLIKLEGHSISDAEDILEEKFKEFYEEPFVKLRYLNKRVVLLGASGGGQVIPLENENMKVTEVLALSSNMESTNKVNNIRLLRGEEMYMIDFSTLNGYLTDNMTVQNGDIIYVEPVKKPFSEFIRDNGPVVSMLSSVVSLVVIIISLN